MPDRSSHPAGAFSYAELATSDLDAARSFYSSLFGWEFHDSPLPMGGVYSMAKKRGRTAAAAFVAPPEQGPPHWNSYVTVASGRMTVVRDPSGAFINFWEARADIGSEVVNEHGSLTWNELATRDPEAAETFYRDLLGWEFRRIPEAPFPL